MQLTGDHPFGVANFPFISAWPLGFPRRRDVLQDQHLQSISQRHTEWVGCTIVPLCDLAVKLVNFSAWIGYFCQQAAGQISMHS